MEEGGKMMEWEPLILSVSIEHIQEPNYSNIMIMVNLTRYYCYMSHLAAASPHNRATDKDTSGTKTNLL